MYIIDILVNWPVCMSKVESVSIFLLFKCWFNRNVFCKNWISRPFKDYQSEDALLFKDFKYLGLLIQNTKLIYKCVYLDLKDDEKLKTLYISKYSWYCVIDVRYVTKSVNTIISQELNTLKSHIFVSKIWFSMHGK